MAQIVINIPAAQVSRVVDALCAAYGYTGDPADGTTKNAFAKQTVIDHIRRVVLGTERAVAEAAALAAVTEPDDPGLS